MDRITVTIEAAEALRHLLDDASVAPEQTLRLVSDNSGDLGLDLDTVREGDQVVEDAGQPVLVIADEVATTISGATIDVIETDDGKMLTILPPDDKVDHDRN
jgi:Fe-S cluster assembly iron-binding protein IscA